MIKKIATLAIALCLLVALLLYNKSRVKKAGLAQHAIDQSMKDDVSIITLVLKGKDTIHIAKKEDVWTTEDSDWPADTSKINKLLGIVFGLQDKEIVSRNTEKLWPFSTTPTKKFSGLISAKLLRWTITLPTGGKKTGR
jgi:hypothetical protein